MNQNLFEKDTVKMQGKEIDLNILTSNSDFKTVLPIQEPYQILLSDCTPVVTTSQTVQDSNDININSTEENWIVGNLEDNQNIIIFNI